jgi:hypothetical protein
LVTNVVALKYNATFKFAGRVSTRELTALLNTDRKYATHVSNVAGATCLGGNVAPFTNTGIIPTTCRT